MTKGKQNVIPFQQGASFYMKRAAKVAEKNDLTAALLRYRKAAESAPDDPEPRIAAAEILSQMLRFEDSNIELMLLLGEGNGTPECHFGIACNFFGMREYDAAANSMEDYLDEDPDGPFAYDAEDCLDLIDDDQAMYEMTGLYSDQDYDDEACVLFVRRLLSGGEYADAITELKHQLTVSPDAPEVKNQLALAYLMNDEPQRAEALAKELIEGDPSNVTAHCVLALLLHGAHDDAGALAEMETLSTIETNQPEELAAVGALQLEMEQYEKAQDTFRALLQLVPYDRAALHGAGYACYMLCDADGAKKCYQKLLAVDPKDTVARFYLQQSGAEPRDPLRRSRGWSIPYQVPYGEMFARMKRLNKLLSAGEATFRRLWATDAESQELLDWALRLPNSAVKRAVLAAAYTMDDARSDRMLREFLLRTDQPDELKRSVLAMMKKRGATPPYMVYLNGQWLLSSRVDMLEFSGELPAAYEEIVQILLRYMVGARPEECMLATAKTLHRFVESMGEKLPHISVKQEFSFAAALEYLGCLSAGEDTDKDEICRKYYVSEIRLNNALQQLQPYAEPPVERQGEDA